VQVDLVELIPRAGENGPLLALKILGGYGITRNRPLLSRGRYCSFCNLRTSLIDAGAALERLD
jgi:hypothetical protein